jgi:hypothetical protein
MGVADSVVLLMQEASELTWRATDLCARFAQRDQLRPQLHHQNLIRVLAHERKRG